MSVKKAGSAAGLGLAGLFGFADDCARVGGRATMVEYSVASRAAAPAVDAFVVSRHVAPAVELRPFAAAQLGDEALLAGAERGAVSEAAHVRVTSAPRVPARSLASDERWLDVIDTGGDVVDFLDQTGCNTGDDPDRRE